MLSISIINVTTKYISRLHEASRLSVYRSHIKALGPSRVDRNT